MKETERKYLEKGDKIEIANLCVNFSRNITQEKRESCWLQPTDESLI